MAAIFSAAPDFGQIMTKLIITIRSGDIREIDAEPTGSLMEMIRDSGLDDLAAICGGNCACATCHVYIDPAYSQLFPPMNNDENELLATSSHRTRDSRLSCQLHVPDGLKQLALRIAEED